MKIAKLIVIAMFFILPVMAALPVNATTITQPDGTPTISHLAGFTYLLEEDDILIYGEYDIPYGANGTLPITPANLTYTFRLFDGATEIGVMSPKVYFDYGYNLGAFSFYFPAASNITFGQEYQIRIQQNPAYFDAPEYFEYSLTTSDWSTASTQTESQTALTVAVISTAQRLENEYVEYGDAGLLEAGLSGTVLSSPIGETYFRNVIYGIQAMAPSLFLLQVLPYDTDETTYTINSTYEERFDGTWVEDDVDATAEQFGLTPTAIMAMIFSLPVCLGFIFVSAKKFHKTEPGFMVAFLIVLVVYMMGWLPAAVFAAIYQIAGIYLAYVWFYSRG